MNRIQEFINKHMEESNKSIWGIEIKNDKLCFDNVTISFNDKDELIEYLDNQVEYLENDLSVQNEADGNLESKESCIKIAKEYNELSNLIKKKSLITMYCWEINPNEQFSDWRYGKWTKQELIKDHYEERKIHKILTIEYDKEIWEQLELDDLDIENFIDEERKET